LTPKSLKNSQQQVYSGFVEPPVDEKYILLTTHNYKADKINTEKLEAIDEKKYFFHAYVKEIFLKMPILWTKKLGLKKGAQVMLVKMTSRFIEKRFISIGNKLGLKFTLL